MSKLLFQDAFSTRTNICVWFRTHLNTDMCQKSCYLPLLKEKISSLGNKIQKNGLEMLLNIKNFGYWVALAFKLSSAAVSNRSGRAQKIDLG